MVYPFAKLFGNSFPVHRSVSAAFTIATCGLMVWIMRWMKTPWVINLGASLILYGHLLFYITPLARPDAMGVFLMVLSVILPFRFRYSDRSLIASILVGLLAFLTKPYFILGLAFVIAYVFVFQSKIKGLRNALYATVAFLGTMAAMNAWGETYINNTFLIHVNVASKSADFLYRQLSTYVQCNLGLLGLLIGGGAFLLWRERSHLRPNFKPQLTQLDRPLLQWDMGLFPWCSLLAFAIFYLSMGRHTGNWLVYLHQLFSPFLLLSLAMVGKHLYDDRASLRRLVLQGMTSGLLLLNVTAVTSAAFLPGLPQDTSLPGKPSARSLASTKPFSTRLPSPPSSSNRANPSPILANLNISSEAPSVRRSSLAGFPRMQRSPSAMMPTSIKSKPISKSPLWARDPHPQSIPHPARSLPREVLHLCRLDRRPDASGSLPEQPPLAPRCLRTQGPSPLRETTLI
ncbi:MAG: hypothetical protein HC860_17670 [Alkalinema sp. RU_4_3]|nr:hypothetical protein [Alkalinema sp. RU_4_3]